MIQIANKYTFNQLKYEDEANNNDDNIPKVIWETVIYAINYTFACIENAKRILYSSVYHV